ncbi:MAG: hypothetical protein K0Q50_3005, partial [Vampirovibrio sp.]|nr:hypothetical protein [Vampirovibrio sp.]
MSEGRHIWLADFDLATLQQLQSELRGLVGLRQDGIGSLLQNLVPGQV